MDVVSFLERLQHCMDGKVGTLKPRPLEEVVHDTVVSGVRPLDFLHIGTRGALGDNSIGGETSRFLLILPENVSSYTRL